MLFSGPLMAKKRKTRQEKIIADLRRKLEATKRAKWEVGSEKLEPEVRNKKEETKTSHLLSQNQASSLTFPTSYIKKDLTKTFVLAILAISLELVLYFFIG